MSRASTTFILTSFILAWPWTNTAAETITHTLTNEAFGPSDCALRIHDYDYNLCPLMGMTATVEEQVFSMGSEDRGEGTSRNPGKRLYELAIGASGLRKPSSAIGRLSGSRASERTCDQDTLLCITEMVPNTFAPNRPKAALRSTTTPAVRRKNGKMKSSFSLSVDHSNVYPPISSLEIKLEPEDEEQSLYLRMICSDAEVLKFIREYNGEYHFAWNTPHACPSRRSQQAVHVLEDHNPDGEAPAPEKEGDQDLLPAQTNYRLRILISIVLALIIFSAAIIYALISSPRLRTSAGERLHAVSYTLLPLISKASSSLKPLRASFTSLTPKSATRLGSRFRQGDSQLVRWAQEDMALEDGDDVMVNGASGRRGNSWDEEGLDEYIPLTMGGRARQARSYGSTPDVETFAERGVKGGLGRLFGK